MRNRKSIIYSTKEGLDIVIGMWNQVIQEAASPVTQPRREKAYCWNYSDKG